MIWTINATTEDMLQYTWLELKFWLDVLYTTNSAHIEVM